MPFLLHCNLFKKEARSNSQFFHPPLPTPQSPIPNPHSQLPNSHSPLPTPLIL
ncbi:MAG: hypothetical protein KME64_44560 [Scytonematopsis contorta HA4267-MV1]|nr:hypothetical protein [Scytonematopsis contorta HA4267-MV1]